MLGTLSAGYAEMIRPEPHQPLDEADLGAERRIEARPGFAEENLRAPTLGSVRLGRQPRPSAGHRLVRLRHAHRALALIGLALGDDLSSAALGAELERRAHGLRAVHQIGVGDLADVRAIELGEQRATRIGGDRGNRAAARAEAKAMQRKRCVDFGSSDMWRSARAAAQWPARATA